MTALLPVFIALFSTSVLGAPNDEIWTPNAQRRWEHGGAILPGPSDSNLPSHDAGVHLLFLDSEDPALKNYVQRYYKQKINKVILYMVDDTYQPNESLKNKKVKLTIVSHGSRGPRPSGDEPFEVKYSINKMSPTELANAIKTFTEQVGFTPQERVRFMSCNAGTQAASNYMTDFIKEINNLGVEIREVVAYRSIVVPRETISLYRSSVTNYPEELYWQFEKQSIRLDRELLRELQKAKILEISSNSGTKDELRMLFTLDNNGNVHRHNFRKAKDNNNIQEDMNSEINRQSDQEHYNQQLDHILEPFCSKRRGRGRRSPSVCSLTEGEVEEEYVMKEKSLTIEDGKVQVELANRHNPEDTHLVSLPLDESFYMKQVEETAKLTQSQVKAGGSQALEGINRAMAVYGIAAGFLGAGKFFAENDTARGAITLTQSLHGLGEMGGLNQQLSRMSQDIFQKALHQAAGELGVEKTIAKISSSVERFGESAAGQFLKDIPIVGLGFQGYFIAEDAIAIRKINRSDPEQNKYFGLQVTNLVLDVSTTVLTIAEVAFPPAAIILEPIVIGLTIARMAISDFYCDVVSELDKLPQGAGDFDKMVAVIAGLEEGAVDFVTGGLLREIDGLEKEQRQNRELLHKLSTPESYYKIIASNGNVSALDLMEGTLSQYGGFVTVRLSNNGNVMIQVGGVDDGQGGVRTIQKSFHNPSIQNIVLGVGESSKFLYTEKAAHLWWVIPVHHEKVICGEIKLHSSLFGTYYGNDKDNKFFAMQQPANKHPVTSTDPCSYGGQDLDFVIKNYHYTIHGHGGDDSFFLGPQSSGLSGGEGRDLYVFPTSGSYAEIDNFAQDTFEDQMIIKAPFSHIDCVRRHTDLLLVYGLQRYTITVKDWFAHTNADHYQHMTFQSVDGVRFKVMDRGLVRNKFHANCVPEILDKTKSQSPISLRLLGEFESVITVLGSNFTDSIVGNEKNNILNGGPGADELEGGEGADTYEIFQGQGCDRINNYAKDQKVDLVVFQVPFSRIQAELRGEDLLVFDEQDVTSTCLQLTKWNTGSVFQHVAFLSSDHVTFHISSNNSGLSITALMIDLSRETHGSKVNLSEPHRHLPYVITVFDSAHDDVIIGNALGNFLSCSGGKDHLQGEGGSDKYAVKSGCKRARISNFAEDQASDVLFLEHPFVKLKARYQWPDLILRVDDSEIEVHLQNWLKGKQFQHLVLQTIDGVIAMLPSNISEPEALIPFEITLSQESCTDNKKTFDFSKDPFKKVERFTAKSSNCSYSVIGNSLDNYIDPGIGNAMNYQYLMGGNGSDTYVLGHGYGYENEIDNKASDMTTDNLFLHVLYKDITVLLDPPHVVLSSLSRNDSVRVRLLRYLQGPEYQHLLIKTSDGFVFQVNPDSFPYKSVLSIDTSTSTKSCNISCAEGGEYLKASHIYGARDFSNYITGGRSSTVITGGSKPDYLHGNDGNERIEGLAGDDIIIGQGGDDVLLGGKGDDDIIGGAGNDMIYGGWGADRIDGGPGVDTVFFSGDVRTSTGVKVNLYSGRGEWADAQNDTYTDIEAVSGTNFNDLIIGDDEDNELVGKFGNDTLVPGHGTDFLFGGPGNDLYILDNCTGVKHINNFASDRALDYILLRDFSPKDACFFLQEGTLVISLTHRNPLLSLIDRDSLTILLDSWSNNSSFYQHVDFVFADDTLVESSFFSTAAEIGPALLELNSTSPTLLVEQVSETAVGIKVETSIGAENTGYKGGSKLQYNLKVSDQLFFSDSLQWTNQPSIAFSGLLSGVIYTFQFYVALCEVPVLVLAETTQRTNPNPPASVNVIHVSHSNAFISWTAPPTDSDPNSSQYSYVVDVTSPWDGYTVQIVTNHTNAEITDLKPATVYRLSVSSVIEGLKSQEAAVRMMKTPNLCPNFIVPEGTRVTDERMTRRGPVVVIECQEGYERTSGPTLLCLEEISFSPCVPKTCVHQGQVISHGSIFHKQCFNYFFHSRCHFGDFQPPVATCCSPLRHIDNGNSQYYRHLSSERGMTVHFNCESGYQLSGPSHLWCDLITGQWSRPFPLLPSCSPIPCPAPPRFSNGRLIAPSAHSGEFKEGDVLRLECDALYHPYGKDRVTCRNGNWEQVSLFCEPSAQLFNTYSQGYRLYGQLHQWKSGSWTNNIALADVERLAKFACTVRQLQFVRIQTFPNIVKCSMINLETSGKEYTGKAEGNIDRAGWNKICIQDYTAAGSFCQLLFPGQDWTVSLLDSTGFSAGYTYRCDGSCRFQRESWRCSSQIQCRAMCDPYPISNGHTTCSSVLEGEWCSVSCNRLYVLKGPFRIQCRRDGWSSNPYCIESGECGYDYERGPHSVGCLTKLWTEVGCNVEANLSPTKRPDYWSGHYSWTVGEVRSKMAILPNDGFLYNPDCQVDDECFPGRATVLTSEGNRKSMSELRLGDRVLALGADGQLTFSEVILWLDRRPTARERYVLLNTEGSPEPLALSADHVTFIAASNVTPASAASMVPVFAKDLRRGHLLYRHNPATGSLVPRRVTDVRDAEDWGAYAPMTVEGNLIVDGHLASCYALQCRQYFAHLPFAPYRLLQALRSHVPFFADLFPMRREQEDEGVHWYASAWHRVGQWFGYPFGKTCYPTELQLYLYP